MITNSRTATGILFLVLVTAFANPIGVYASDVRDGSSLGSLTLLNWNCVVSQSRQDNLIETMISSHTLLDNFLHAERDKPIGIQDFELLKTFCVSPASLLPVCALLSKATFDEKYGDLSTAELMALLDSDWVSLVPPEVRFLLFESLLINEIGSINSLVAHCQLYLAVSNPRLRVDRVRKAKYRDRLIDSYLNAMDSCSVDNQVILSEKITLFFDRNQPSSKNDREILEKVRTRFQDDFIALASSNDSKEVIYTKAVALHLESLRFAIDLGADNPFHSIRLPRPSLVVPNTYEDPVAGSYEGFWVFLVRMYPTAPQWAKPEDSASRRIGRVERIESQRQDVDGACLILLSLFEAAQNDQELQTVLVYVLRMSQSLQKSTHFQTLAKTIAGLDPESLHLQRLHIAACATLAVPEVEGNLLDATASEDPELATVSRIGLMRMLVHEYDQPERINKIREFLPYLVNFNCSAESISQNFDTYLLFRFFVYALVDELEAVVSNDQMQVPGRHHAIIASTAEGRYAEVQDWLQWLAHRIKESSHVPQPSALGAYVSR